MKQFLDFAFRDRDNAVVAGLFVGIIGSAAISGIVAIVRAIARAITIGIYGYPPPHCDALGEPVDRADEEES